MLFLRGNNQQWAFALLSLTLFYGRNEACASPLRVFSRLGVTYAPARMPRTDRPLCALTAVRSVRASTVARHDATLILHPCSVGGFGVALTDMGVAQAFLNAVLDFPLKQRFETLHLLSYAKPHLSTEEEVGRTFRSQTTSSHPYVNVLARDNHDTFSLISLQYAPRLPSNLLEQLKVHHRAHMELAADEHKICEVMDGSSTVKHLKGIYTIILSNAPDSPQSDLVQRFEWSELLEVFPTYNQEVGPPSTLVTVALNQLTADPEDWLSERDRFLFAFKDPSLHGDCASERAYKAVSYLPTVWGPRGTQTYLMYHNLWRAARPPYTGRT